MEASVCSRPMSVVALVALTALCALPRSQAASGQPEGGAIRLVLDGTDEYVVVLSQEASAAERWAAEELVDHVRRMTGATLAVRFDEGPVPEKSILIGDGEGVRGLGVRLDMAGLGADGFVIRTVGDRLVIAGGRQRGTLYGVYTLLENLGCRWWTPSESTIPRVDTLAIPPMDVLEVPKLEYRDLMYRELQPSAGPAGPIWMARNKVNGMIWHGAPDRIGGSYRFGGGKLAHTLVDLLKKHRIDATPEMMAVGADGRRVAPGRRGSQMCFSSQAAVDAMTRAVVEEYRQDPRIHFVVVGQEDGHGYCRCEQCQALAQKEGSQAGPLIHFVNQVAERAKRQVPGAAVATNAYVWSRRPPASIRPRRNVYVIIASYECDFGHPMATSTAQAGEWGSVQFRRDLEGWQRIAPKIFVWDYSTNFLQYLTPYPNLDILAPNMKYYADHGVTGVMSQGAWGAFGAEFSQLRAWVIAKAMWDPEADNQALIHEFLRGYYGPAAPAIQRYIDVMHAYIREHPEYVLGIYKHLNSTFIAPAIIADAEAALREADAAVAGTDPDLERRVRHAHMPVWYVLLKMGPGSSMWRAVETKVGDLDPTAVAANFSRVVEEYTLNEVCEGGPGKAFFQWVVDYGRLCAGGRIPAPAELEGADLQMVRLIQACQMDRGAAWYTPADGASDGWAVSPSRGRQLLHYLSDTNDYTPDRAYRAFVRARGEGVAPDAEGEVWSCGIGSRGSISVTAEQLRDGDWHTFDIGRVAPQGIGDGFWSSVLWRDRDKIQGVLIDCIWLQESR